MDHDDDEEVGFIAESHYLKSPTHQQAMALLQVPPRAGRTDSVSSSLSDLDVPIYSSENLTTRSARPVEAVSGECLLDGLPVRRLLCLLCNEQLKVALDLPPESYFVSCCFTCIPSHVSSVVFLRPIGAKCTFGHVIGSFWMK